MKAQEILTQAKEKGMALGAFNAGNLEIVKAIVAAGQSQKAALIISTSSREAKFFEPENFQAIVNQARQKTDLPLLTNLDHGRDLEECQQAINLGYDLVHFDGSALPYEENVKITQEVVKLAHQKGVLVEGEMDRIAGQSAPSQEEPESLQAQTNYTDPAKAAEFVQQTGIDVLAVFVGNLHGTYAKPPKLDLDRLKQLAQLPCQLSLHGGSGLNEDDIKQAIAIGVVKINVNTELRVAYRETLANVLKGSEEVAIYQIMPPVIAAVQKVVEEKIQLFGKASPATEPGFKKLGQEQ